VLDGEDINMIFDGIDETTFTRKNPTLIFHQAGRRNPDSAARKGKYKLVKHWAKQSNKEDVMELYNPDVDLGETNDIADEYPEIVADLHAKLLAHIKETNSEYTFNKRATPMNIIFKSEGMERGKSQAGTA